VEFPISLAGLLAPAGVAVVFGYLQSYLLEWAPWFGEWTAMRKRLFLALLGVVLSVLALAITTYVPAATIEALNPWYIAVITGVTMVSTEVAHKVVN